MQLKWLHGIHCHQVAVRKNLGQSGISRSNLPAYVAGSIAWVDWMIWGALSVCGSVRNTETKIAKLDPCLMGIWTVHTTYVPAYVQYCTIVNSLLNWVYSHRKKGSRIRAGWGRQNYLPSLTSSWRWLILLRLILNLSITRIWWKI